MITDVLIALVIFHSACWIAKHAWKAFRQKREQEALAQRREHHRAHRSEQLKRAVQNRKARRQALLASKTPELRAVLEKVFHEDLP